MVDLSTPHLVTSLLLALLACTAVTIVRTRSLLAAIMLTGIYSFLGAGWMVLLDAPDVAFTEAAVGAGVATILALATVALIGHKADERSHSPLLPLAVVVLTGGVLVFGTVDMPHYGDPLAPSYTYPSPSYIERTREEIGIPNVVTAVLASYRGYDTLGETTVIFTAGISVLLILRGRKRRRERGAP